MLTGAPDLDDVTRLQSADVHGLLRAAALAGAQVRAVAAAVDEQVLAPLADLRPRAVVIVTGHGTARRAADLVVATLAARTDVPVVVADSLPGWIGPLDVVVVSGDDAGDMALADAAARSVRRRAEVVIDAPMEGPIRDAAAGSALDLSPRVPVRPEFRFVGHVVALSSVIRALRAVRTAGPDLDLSALAEALDDEAGAAHPDNEVFHNAAKGLASRISGRPVTWAGDTPASTVLAVHASRTLHAVAGVGSVGCDLVEAVAAQAARPEASGEVDSIFHDPEFDGPAGGPAVRVQVITTPGREWSLHQRMSVLSDADVVEVGPAGDTGPAPLEPGAPAGVEGIDTPADIAPLLLAALRIEMAAVYLRLIGAV
ncbi:hypothetical protein ACQ7HM_15260 [Williamsia sp. MIQD14]|uniref:hypothetical protein n=1 Tax=Williamsia sp. MIQD14 TaxID=3425703 RepID=UPI003DA1554C